MNPAPAEHEPVKPEDAVEVGRILGAWGVRGEIRVKPFAADAQALFACRQWFVEPSEAKPGHLVPRAMQVLQARAQGEVVVARVREVADRDAAAALAGARVFVSRSSFPTPGDGEFYWVDLIGLDVLNQQAQGLGRVVGLIETGPHCVLRIQPGDALLPELLIPFVDAYVGQVDMAARTIHVDWQSDF